MKGLILIIKSKEKEIKEKEMENEANRLHYNLIERELSVLKHKYQLTHSSHYKLANSTTESGNFFSDLTAKIANDSKPGNITDREITPKNCSIQKLDQFNLKASKSKTNSSNKKSENMRSSGKNTKSKMLTEKFDSKFGNQNENQFEKENIKEIKILSHEGNKRASALDENEDVESQDKSSFKKKVKVDD